MKRLLLIRHAKATHETGFADFERPLTQAGLHDAAMMAGRVLTHALVPELIVASPALRTISTANVFSQHLSIPAAQENLEIYEAGQNELVNIVSHLPDGHNFVALVGHNPGMAQLLYYLTGRVHNVPPCSVAAIEFDEADSWAEITGDSGRLTYYDYPEG